jgi:DNA repair protein RecN (Recombination protein N)
MTAITGETGTGKSVLLGALAMILGDRADSDRIRPGAERTDVTATFLLNDLPDAKQWLVDNDLCSTDEECLLRRIHTKNGRSRAFINAQPVTLQQLKALGALLIDIHSQHAHQSLLSKTAHQRLLDEFAQHSTLVQQVGQAYRHWQKLNSQYLRLHNNSDELNARYQLLQYQVNELSQLGLNDGEIEPLEREQQALASAESLISKNQQIDALCDDEQGISSLLNQTLSILSSSSPQTESTKAIYELLNQALIYVDEARSELRDQLDATTLDPERLQQVEARLSQIYDVARKHRINTSELPALHQKLATELTELSSGDESLVAIEAKSIQAQQQFLTLAEQLSQQRQESARLLE